MIDRDGLAQLADGSVADLVTATHRRTVEADADLLVLAGAWAHRFEVHPDQPGRAAAARGRGVPAAVRDDGGVGTPLVDGDAVIEFGTLAHTTTMTAQSLIADALDLEHRLPVLWRRVCRGEVVAWQARKIAKATRHLSTTAAGYVDRAVADHVASLPWGRLQTLVEAKIIESDPAAARARAQAADADRFVRTGRTTEHGLATIFARVDAGDAIWFCAMIDRLATILAEDGDTDPVDVRRSKAIGIIADPPLATQLLATHGQHTTSQNRQDDAGGQDRSGPEGGGQPSPDDQPSKAQQPHEDQQTGGPRHGTPGGGDEPGNNKAAPSGWAAGRREWWDRQRAARDAEEVPAREQAWPGTDPWEQHRRIPDNIWQAVHRRHRDDLGPGPVGAAAPPGTGTPPSRGRSTGAAPCPNGDPYSSGGPCPRGDGCSRGEACLDAAARTGGEVCPATDPADWPAAETGRGRAGDPDRAATTLAGLLDDPTLRRRLAPTAVVYLHLSADALLDRDALLVQGDLLDHQTSRPWPGKPGQPGRVGRIEGAGPVTVGQVRRFLGSGRVNVTIKPVIDLNDTPPAADSWEIPAAIRERTRLRMPAEVFPWAASTSTSPDLDHTIPYVPTDRGGAPGQTSETKLGPLGRAQHNAKTRGRWQVRQPAPGVFVWRSPHRRTLIVDPDGTHDRGRGLFADQLWHAARACPPAGPGPQPVRTAPVVDLCQPGVRVEVILRAA